MSEYAEIVNGEVVNVLVIDDSWTEEQAQEFLAKVSSNKWKKTEEKAGKGYEYHADIDKITPKKPFKSWKLNKDNGRYEPPLPAPLAVPIGYIYYWSEKAGKWIVEKVEKI